MIHDKHSLRFPYTSAGGCAGTQTTVPGFLFEETTEGGVGPASIQAFLDGCVGLDYFEGASARCGEAVVGALDAMYHLRVTSIPTGIP
jgi:hypothetical protein